MSKNVQIQNVNSIENVLKINSNAKSVSEKLVRELFLEKGHKIDQ
jgi:hypothetical protein